MSLRTSGFSHRTDRTSQVGRPRISWKTTCASGSALSIQMYATKFSGKRRRQFERTGTKRTWMQVLNESHRTVGLPFGERWVYYPVCMNAPKQRLCLTCGVSLGSNIGGKKIHRLYCSPRCWPQRKLTDFKSKAELRAYYDERLPSHSWQAYRVRIVSHARQVFAKSGLPRECAVCNYAHHVQICHIRSVSDFPESATIAEINAIGNLIPLCPNHHWEFDHKLLQLSGGRSGVERIPTNHPGFMSHGIAGSTPAAATTFHSNFYRPAKWVA